MKISIARLFLILRNKLKHLVSIIIFLAVFAGTLLILSRWKTVTVFIDGKEIEFATNEGTVGAALKEREIETGPKDIVEPALNSELKDKENITIRHTVDIKVSVDGKHLDITTPEETVGSMLNEEGITLDSDDEISVDRWTKLSEGMEIVITRVDIKTVTESLPINFNEVVKKDSRLANTKRKVTQEGRDGEKQVTTKIVYEDGREVSREVVDEKVTVSPIDRIIVQGTYPLMPVSRGGDPVAYSKVFEVRATAYWAIRGVGKTYTASGRKAVRDPEGYSTIAVDPNVIPYSTKLFVEGYGFAIAADTGTAIIGNRIDVFFNTYNEACKWGAKYVNVYVLK